MTDPALSEVLLRSRELGFLGPGPVEAHVSHAMALADVAEALLAGPPARFLDLGSGGGVPGLALAARWPEASAVLLDSNERRTTFLEEACTDLGLAARVTVVRARAEVAGHERALRGQADLVVARSFGPPAVTAECAAPLLAAGGLLLVTEPPDPAAGRWPLNGLATLGLEPISPPVAAGVSLQALRSVAPCPSSYPRRTGIPAKRPLF